MSSPRSVVTACNAASRIFALGLVPASTLRLPSSTRLSTRVSRRMFHLASRNAAASPAAAPDVQHAPPEPTNPALSFSYLDAVESRSVKLHRSSLEGGPEPSYNVGKHLTYHSHEPLLLHWGGVLPEFSVAYETWGTLNSSKSNAILLHTGLSASSHAHSTPENPKPGWWEKFIGPGKPLDTDNFFVICTNVIGSCYGSTGPSSIDPANGERYATQFPILTMEDMVRAQFRLLDALGIEKLYASVGSSMGGMQSLTAACLFPERVSKVVSISGCARSHPYSIAMRHTQRQVLMMDPNWNRGFYYDSITPHMGMKMAREIATVTYRSGPEWEQRFGRRRADPSKPPALCPDFLVETYLDHAGEKFCLEFDPNSLLYVSKAMDLFDLGHEHRERIATLRTHNALKLQNYGFGSALCESGACNLTLPEKPYEEQPEQIQDPASQQQTEPFHMDTTVTDPPAQRVAHEPPQDLVRGMQPMSNIPTLVLGVATDILFPSWQQREIAETLKRTGNKKVWHIELGEEKSLFGHDTFMLDLENVGGVVGAFLR